jgi:putative Holliday junction resolvase
LGIDFGEKRIGLALSDPEGRYALPWKTLARKSDRQALAEISELIASEQIAVLAIGEPRRPADGADTAAARRVRAFGERLAAATGLPIVWVDETLTSAAAEDRLAEAGVSRARRAEHRDAIAAQIVLEEALGRRRPTPETPASAKRTEPSAASSPR